MHTPNDPSTTHEPLRATEVEDFLVNFEKLASEQDFDLLEPKVHPDAVFRFNDGDHHGIHAVRAAFEATWARSADAEEVDFYLTDIKVLSLDQGSASATYNYTWRGRFGDRTFAVQGRGTRVLVRHGDTLQILHEHLSLMPQPNQQGQQQ